MGPACIGVSAAQISALINTQLASLLGDGAISWITYADRLMEFPTRCSASRSAPCCCRRWRSITPTRTTRVLGAARLGLRLAFLLALPAAVALW
jgi:putative peptidoglycan lipid II flippase